MRNLLGRFGVATVLALSCAGASAGDDYLIVNDLATCSSFYAHMRDSSESKTAARGYDAAEARVFARLEKEMGRETAIHMTRASWNTWRELVGSLSNESWNRRRLYFEELCPELE